MAVFGLKKIYLNQVQNNYENYDQVTVSSYGYYGGGYVSSGIFKSDFDRIDYSNETTTLLPSTLSFGRAHHSVVQKDAEYGYLSGGFGGPTNASSSNIDKIDLTNEVVSRLPVNYPRTAIYGAYGVYTPQYGYYAGYDDGDGSSSYIDRLNFSDETFSTITAVLPDSKRLTSGLHSSVYGYWTGGVPGGGTGRINFSNETVGSIPGLPSLTARTSALTGDAAILYSGNGGVCSIDRFTFSGETTATTTALRSSSSANEYVGSSESPQYGYFVGGGTLSTSTIDRYDFSHDTNVRSTSSLTTVRGRMSGGGGINGGSKITRGKPQFNSIQREIDQKSCGYIAGGLLTSTPYITKSNVLKLDFSTDLSTELTANLSTAAPSGTNSVKSRDYGYFGGGYNVPPFTTYCTIDRFDFTSETMMTPGTGLTQNAGYSATTQTTSFGYFIGGQPATCLITRLDYSTELTSQQSLYKARKRASAIENQLYSYITGTNTTSLSSEISRYDFVNETNAAIPAITTAYLEQSAATGNNQFGFIHLGYTPTGDSNTINRIDYSNETINAPGNNLTNQVRNVGGLSSNTFGYFGGGYSSPLTFVSTLDKIDFDTETKVTTNSLVGYKGRITQGVEGKYTSTQTIQNTLKESPKYAYYAAGNNPASSVERLDNTTETISAPPVKRQSSTFSMAAAENSQYGYFFGGTDGANRTTIQRLDFSSDIFSVSNSNISMQNNRITSAYTDDYAYVFGSYQKLPSPTPYKSKTSIDRFEYDNETLKVFGGMSSEAREGMIGTQSSYFGYVAGGSMNPPALGVSRVDKLDFTTEISSVLTEGLSHNRRIGAAVQNQNFGYFAGGQTTPGTGNRTNVDRVDFSTETITHPGNYDLTQARQGLTGSESSDYGYFIGGYTSNTVCTFERLEFETETLSLPGGSANSIMYSATDGLNGGSSLRQVGKNNRNDSRAGLDNQGRNVGASYGYFVGGNPGGPTSTRIDYLNETTSEPSALISGPSSSPNGITCVSNPNYGYVAGGYNLPPSTNESRIDRFDHSNETSARTSNPLTTRTGFLYQSAQNKNYGYFAGGYETGVDSGTKLSTIQRLDFDSETVDQNNSRLLVGDITNGYVTIFNKNYSYYIGDFDAQTNACRLDFSTENVLESSTITNVSIIHGVGLMTENEGYALSNLDYNQTPITSSTIYKLDFSSETLSSIANKLSRLISSCSGNQNTNYGYIGGGTTPSTPGTTSYIDRFEFSTETASNPGNPMTRSRRQNAGYSNIPVF